MKRIVLLGAGASFGSEKEHIKKPPLGANLFSELEARGGVARSLPDDLKEKFKNFEQGMAEFFDRYDGDTSGFQRDLAEYLSCFMPTKRSLYKKLVRLFGEDSLYVSLNYDLLLERAAIAEGLSVAYSLMKTDGFINLLKIHGSSNFWPNFGSNKIIVNGFVNCGVDVDVPVMYVHPEYVSREFYRHSGIAPAIAMFAEGKSVRVCPEAIRAQQEMWESALGVADSLYIIGVRVHEVDDHIWGNIGRFKGVVNYFGFDSDFEEYRSWVGSYPGLNSKFHKMDFKEALRYIGE